MLVFGEALRQGNSFLYHNDLWSYSPARDEWTQLKLGDQELPAERAYHACAWDSQRQRMWVYGGCQGDFEGRDDLWCFDPQTRKWTNLAPPQARPSGRLGATLHYYPRTDSLLLVGGAEGFGEKASPVHEVWVYDIANNKWTERKCDAPHRWLAATTLDAKHGLVIVFGGIDEKSGVHRDTWVYDIEKDKWREPLGGRRPTNSLPGIWNAAQGRMIVHAGTLPMLEAKAYDDVFAFDPTRNAWKEIEVVGPKPVGRAYHSAVWVPEARSLMIFGGTTNQFSDPAVENTVWTLRWPAK
jgi:N-acetylneuraminic acid mutarotase